MILEGKLVLTAQDAWVYSPAIAVDGKDLALEIGRLFGQEIEDGLFYDEDEVTLGEIRVTIERL